MIETILPPNEAQRLSALYALKILDTPPEDRFDRVTRLVKSIFNVPFAMVTLVDSDRQWFKSCQGLGINQIPRSIPICAYTILNPEPLIISDALQDERFAQNPFVTNEPFARFYAGFPLATLDGHRIGTLCMLDTRPRQLSEDQLTLLKDLAAIVEAELNMVNINQLQQKLETANNSLEAELAERKRAEAALVTQEKRIRSLYEISTQLGLGIDERFQATLEMGAKLLGLDIGIISHIEDSAYKICHVYAPNTDLAPKQVIKLEQTYCELTTAANDVVAIDNVLESAYKEHPCYQDFQLKAYIGVPLTVHGKLFGTLNFSSPNAKTTPFNQTDKDFVRLMAQWVNITLERLRTREELAQAHDEALESSRLKTQLLANVSHDVRTPLNAILGYAEMLQEGLYGDLNSHQADTTAKIIDSTGQLLNFVNNLLDQARIDSGQVILNIVPFRPADLLDAVFSAIGVLAHTKKLDLIYSLAPDVPQKFLGDFYWLRQILINLGGNAIKFTDHGTVHMHIYLYDENYWAVDVSDSGVGIPPEAQAYIFDKFRQVDGTITREHSGSGLGLSIVKQLVHLMGGEVDVKSQPVQGSTFTIILPLKPTQEGQHTT